MTLKEKVEFEVWNMKFKHNPAKMAPKITRPLPDNFPCPRFLSAHEIENLREQEKREFEESVSSNPVSNTNVEAASSASIITSADTFNRTHHGSEDDIYASMNRDSGLNNMVEEPHPAIVVDMEGNNPPKVVNPPVTKYVGPSENVPEASMMMPRVEDEQRYYNVDFSTFYEKDNPTADGGVEFNPAANGINRGLYQAEKDLPPEERSLAGRINNFIIDGAKPDDPNACMTVYQQPVPFAPNPFLTMQQPMMNQQPQQMQMNQQPQQKVTVDPAIASRPDYGRFAQDNPKPVKPPKAPKAEADNSVEGVETVKKIMEGATGVLGITEKEPRKPDFIQGRPKIDPPTEDEQKTVVAATNISNNEELIKKHWWLKEIAQIASEQKCMVNFKEIPDMNGNESKILKVDTFVLIPENKMIFNSLKSFIVDYGGNFYDRKLKLFLTTDPNYVINGKLQGFALTKDSNQNNGGKNSKKVIDTDLLRDIFICGSIGIDPQRGIYREQLRTLNVFVDISSLPNDKEDRDIVRNRLLKSVDVGIFGDSICNYCRFKVADYDKKSKSFVLVNNVLNNKIVSILYGPGGATLKPGIPYDQVMEEFKAITGIQQQTPANNG